MAEKRKGRRAYLEDFKKNAQGEYEYRGNLYLYPNGTQELRRKKGRLWILCAVTLAALVTAGCITAPGAGSCVYVLLPYTVGLVSGASVCWALCRFTAGGHPLREYIYQASVEKLPGRSLLTAVSSAAAAIGDLVFLLLYGAGGNAAGAAVFLAAVSAAAIGAAAIRRSVLGMRWEMEKEGKADYGRNADETLSAANETVLKKIENLKYFS